VGITVGEEVMGVAVDRAVFLRLMTFERMTVTKTGIVSKALIDSR
jgi:hypothetical protein